MEGGEGENRGHKGEQPDQSKAQFQINALGALRGMNFASRNGTGRDGVVPGFRSAFLGYYWNLFEGHPGFFGDGPRAAQRGGMGEPLFPPFAPVDGRHVELREFAERRDGSARIACCGDSAAIG